MINWKAILLLTLAAAGTAFAGSELLFENSDFEKGTLENWTAEGDAMTLQPTKGDNSQARGRESAKLQGDYYIGTFEKYDGKSGRPGAVRRDGPTGKLTSIPFAVANKYIAFRIGGGTDITRLGVSLIHDGEEIRLSTGFNSETMKQVSADVSKFQGKKIQLVICDQSSGGWGHINVDDFRWSDEPLGRSFVAVKQPKLKDEWSTFPLYERVGYDQPLRPQFHFTSRMGWLNDPNGMVYYDGEWHMYFQHYAKGNASGPKSWGSARSPDLMHWVQGPHAFNPYPNVKWKGGPQHAIWSGSAVVDELNALGKQTGDVKTLFAIFTATHSGEDKKAAFFQVGGYSTDRGRTWTMIHNGRPLIDHLDGYDPGQRDPRVFFHAPTQTYMMIMEIGGKNRDVRLWKSTDLMNWESFLDIPHKSAECIDMYHVALDGNPNNRKWVIADAGTHYEVGDFDGETWTGFGDKDKDGKRLRFDLGDSYYAAQVFNQAPDGRVVHIGWLRSKQPGYRPFLEADMPFTQQMSIPAEITLRTTPDGIRMFRNPVREIEKLYVKTDRFTNVSVQEANARLARLKPELIDMTIEFVPAGELTLEVRGLPIKYHAGKQVLSFTNTARVEGEKAGMATLPPDRQRPYRDNGRREIPAPTINGKVKLRVLVDRASLELFANDGHAAASFVVVPDADNRTISIEADAGTKLRSVVVNELKSAWKQ